MISVPRRLPEALSEGLAEPMRPAEEGVPGGAVEGLAVGAL